MQCISLLVGSSELTSRCEFVTLTILRPNFDDYSEEIVHALFSMFITRSNVSIAKFSTTKELFSTRYRTS